MSIEQAANELQQLKTTLQHFKAAAAEKDKDAAHRKQSRLASQYTLIHAKLRKILTDASATGREFEDARYEEKKVHHEFEKLHAAFTSASARAAAAAGESSTQSASQQQQQQQQQQALMQKYDESSLDTMLAYQRERTQGIREIEQSSAELRGMFADARDLISAQHPGIDTVGKNLDAATKNVQNGTAQLKKARSYQ